MPMRDNERIFVTGDGGNLAGAVMAAARELGMQVINDDYYGPRGWEEMHGPEIDLLGDDIDYVARHRPTIVVHTAALVNTDKCAEDPHSAFACNVQATFNVIEKLYKPDVHFYYFGTTASYDPTAPRPMHLNSPKKPATLYGKTKLIGEDLVKRFVAFDDLTIIRPCFVYGGVDDTSSVLAKLIHSALDPDMPAVKAKLDPEKQKDFLYKDDFQKMMKYILLGGYIGQINLVNGNPRPYGDAVKILRDMGLEPRVEFDPAGDYLGDHVFQEEVGWKFERTSLEDGIAAMVKQIKESSYA